MAGEDGARDADRVHQRDHVGAKRGLLARTKCRGIAKSRRAKAAQIGNDDADTLRGQLRGDIDIGMNVVGKAVQQDRRPVRSAGPAS